MLMARALQAFIERQGVKVPTSIDAVLIAGEPGLHIDSVRPAIKVMMIDGIKSFVSGLATGRPVISAEAVFEMTERILNPRLPKKESGPPPAPEPRAAWEQQEPPQQEVSRARAIFSASDQAKPFDPADFDFAMTDDEPLDEAMPANIPSVHESSPAIPVIQSKPKARRILGMTVIQIVIIAALALCLISILIVGFVYINPLGL
jgi:hypothetical protein